MKIRRFCLFCVIPAIINLWSLQLLLFIFLSQKITYSPEKKYNYRNSSNMIKTTIIVIISKSGQGKTYNEYEAGKNAS